MGRPKGCTPWNKGLDQRTGLPPNAKLRAAWAAHRRRLREALRCGILERPALCDKCGRETFTHAHSRDYRQPLIVDWLCKRCQPKGPPFLTP